MSIGGLYAVCLVLCGASVAAIPPAAATNYWILASASAAFGLFFAASYTFTPSLLVKLVSLDDFTSAYGLVLLAQGIGHLIGPPLSGEKCINTIKTSVTIGNSVLVISLWLGRHAVVGPHTPSRIVKRAGFLRMFSCTVL